MKKVVFLQLGAATLPGLTCREAAESGVPPEGRFCHKQEQLI